MTKPNMFPYSMLIPVQEPSQFVYHKDLKLPCNEIFCPEERSVFTIIFNGCVYILSWKNAKQPQETNKPHPKNN